MSLLLSWPALTVESHSWTTSGMRQLFPLVSAAVDRTVGLDRLRWIAFSHVEADECSAMNQCLAAAPRAQVATGRPGSP